MTHTSEYITFSFSHLTYCNHMSKGTWDLLTGAPRPKSCDKFHDYRSRGIRDIKFLFLYMRLYGHMIKGRCDLVNGNPLR